MTAPGMDDRLPWLESPRPAARPRRAPGARRARTPLLVLLGLFFAGAIAVMAFIVGRGTAPRPMIADRTIPSIAAPTPIRPAPIAPRLAEAPAVTPSAAPTAPLLATKAAPPRATATEPRPKRAVRTASASRPVKARRVAARSARPKQRQAAIRRNPIPVPAGLAAAPRRAAPWPAQPFVGPRGKVVQLGAFVTMRQADAAWWRLLRAYPYLGTLPRMVSWIGPTPGRPRYYRVRLAASSRREARALCNNLHRIGRGCMVV